MEKGISIPAVIVIGVASMVAGAVGYSLIVEPPSDKHAEQISQPIPVPPEPTRVATPDDSAIVLKWLNASNIKYVNEREISFCKLIYTHYSPMGPDMLEYEGRHIAAQSILNHRASGTSLGVCAASVAKVDSPNLSVSQRKLAEKLYAFDSRR